MNFSFQVEANQDFIFKPTQLDIYIGAKETIEGGAEIVNVQTVLTQIQPGKKTVETADHQFPVAMLQPAILSYSIGDSKPKIDPVKLGQLLAPFNLRLVVPDTTT